MAYTTVLYEKQGRVAQITLNRPERLNALSGELSADIAAALQEANQDPDVRAVVMTGTGRAFSAGADLSRGGGEQAPGTYSGRDLLGWYNSTEEGLERSRAMRRLQKPIVAALNGYTLGAGFELAITCDILIASEQAVMGAPEIRHGSIVATFLPFLVGPMWAKRMILTGDHISAQTAKEIGLLVDVVPHEELLPAALALAERIAMVPPLAVRLNKRMLDGILEMSGLDKSQEYGHVVAAICHTLGDQATDQAGRRLSTIRETEGLRAMLEARDGPFGRTPL